MKYKAKQLQSGNWAVFTGKRFFTDTETTSKDEAIENALIRSMSFYQGQMDDAFDELEKHCINSNGDVGMGRIKLQDGNIADKGVLMC